MTNNILRRTLSFACGVLISMVCAGSAAAGDAPAMSAAAKTPVKVILDTDMVELFDDGIAMMMLLNDPGIDLLGVVTVTGNSWANDGMAYLVKQLSVMKTNRKQLPVLAIGEQYPYRRGGGFGRDILKKELASYGDVMEGYIGAQETDNPKSWKDAYKKRYGVKAPDWKVREDGVNYLIEMAHRYPHQIKLVAIGPTTNIARAVQKDPEVAALFDEVIYMGGAFWVKGNAHENAEFNIWLDPESTRVAYRAPFDNQTFVALDVTDKTIMDHDRFNKIRSHIKNPELLKMFNESFFAKRFDADKDNRFSWFVWDVIAAAITIDPSLILATRHAYVDCVDQPGPSYGRTVPYTKDEAPEGTRSASIVQEIDQDRFWNMLYSYLEQF